MQPHGAIYILGSGAIGLPLAAYLTHAGRHAVAVRTSVDDVPKSTITVSVDNGSNNISVVVDTISLTRLTRLDGLIVIAAKSHANHGIARMLHEKGATGPIVIMQNGIGVEEPFLDASTSQIYRCVLYATSRASSGHAFAFRPVTSSPVGIARGTDAGLMECVKELSTDEFPLRAEGDIQRETWKKAIINAVFNSICPLLDVDNGVFVRDAATASLARQLVRECLMVTKRLDMDLDERELMDQIAAISDRSSGQPISTLQDIRRGRQTEMQYLNLEIVRVAAAMQPALPLPRIDLLGKLIVAKSLLAQNARQ
ncbi:MAG TPA: 2-dehydropantoate 2-reductase [Burkholderiaceae bacterium]|nr:2-dehydropantoate 2-reductase [Burkholderiaceae bacterium]